MPETEAVLDDLRNITQIVAYLRRSGTEIYQTRNLSRRDSLKDYLMDAKTNLLSLRTKLSSIPPESSGPPVDKINDLVTALDSMHADLNQMPVDTVQEELDTIQRIFSTMRGILPYPLLAVQVDLPAILLSLHKTIRSEVKRDFEEVTKCYSVQAYRASLAFCARIAELVLRRKYYEKKRRQRVAANVIEAELSGATLGQVIGKCRDAGMMNAIQGLNEYSSILNRLRIPSLHVTIQSFDPGPNATRGAIEFTLALIRALR